MINKPHSTGQLIFQVRGNKESQLTPWVLLIIVVTLILLSVFKLAELNIVSLPVLGIFLWIAITLIRQCRQPWIVANRSCLELKYKDSNNRIVFLTVPWENIKSIELSQPYKDLLIINLLNSINVGANESMSNLITSNEFYDIDPDELLSKLSKCLGSNNSNTSQNIYVPNVVPLKDRVVDSFFVLILIGWGIYSLVYNDLPLPTKRGAMHLHGIAMWLMLAALIAAAANLISWVLDHYDQRDNEKRYRAFRAYSRATGYLFFSISLVAWLLDGIVR